MFISAGMTASPFARPLWIAAGLVSLAFGIAGVVLPILPTTPFMILSAFCFARGSVRLHRWLTTHPRFGPAIDDWTRHRAISMRAKRLAVAAMAATFLIALAAGFSGAVLAIQAVALSGAATFILTRPSPPG